MARISPFFKTAAVGLAVLTGMGAAGCGRRGKDRSLKDIVRKKIGEQVKEPPLIAALLSNNKFTVDDEKGQRLLEADVKKVDGKMVAGQGLDGPVKMVTAKCRVFKNGKLEMTLDSPEAIWDGKTLISEKQVHAVTAAQDKIIDAKRSVWTASTGKLDLEQAKLQSMDGKKLEMTAEAPVATVLNKVATMPKGGVGRNPDGDQMKADQFKWHFGPKRLEGAGNVTLTNAKGSQLTSNKLNWMMDSGKVEADGNVVLREEGTTVTGQRLRANIELKRGRLSGSTRVVMKKSVLPKKNG